MYKARLYLAYYFIFDRIQKKLLLGAYGKLNSTSALTLYPVNSRIYSRISGIRSDNVPDIRYKIFHWISEPDRIFYPVSSLIRYPVSRLRHHNRYILSGIQPDQISGIPPEAP